MTGTTALGLKTDSRSKFRRWAPGSYCCRCAQCGAEFVGDKLAAQCADCAYDIEPLIQQARSQAVQACIDVVTEKIAEYEAATDITEAARWSVTSSLTVIASRLEALKGST